MMVHRLIRASIAAAALLVVVASPLHAAAATVLLGDQNVEAGSDSDTAGKAEAFRTTATASGQLGAVSVYVATGSAATTLVAGVYADSGGHPGTLLAQGTLASPASGAWNTVALGATPAIAAGGTYWIAILSPSGRGTLAFRDVTGGGASETSASATLGTLPSSWVTGAVYRDGPLSAYGTGTVGPDTTPPSAPTNLLLGTVSQTSAQLSWSPSSDNVAVTGYDTYLNGAKVGTTTNTSYTFSPLTCNTAYTFGVVAFDAATNRSGQSTLAGSTPPCDTTPPTVTITSSPGNPTNQTSAGFGFTSSKSGSTFQCSLDGSPLAGCSSPAAYTSLATGSHTFQVQATDTIGNVGPPAAFTWTIDTTPPTVALTAPAAGATLSGSNVAVSASATDDLGPTSVQFQLDGRSFGAPVTAPPYTIVWDSTGTPNGSHTLTARAQDAAGNTGVSSVSVTVANAFDTSNAFKEVVVGQGWVDATERQVVRTTGNAVYIFAGDDKVVPGVVRAWKGAPIGIPTSFAEVDAVDHPRAGGTDVISAVDARLDRNGIVHTVYLDNYFQTSLVYQTFSTLTDTWGATETIATGVGAAMRNRQRFSLTLDNNDKPHVVYMSGTSILYTNRVSGSWSAPQLVGTDSSPIHPSLVFDPAGNLHLVWVADGSPAMVKYKMRAAGGAWGATEIVASSVLGASNGDSDPSIVVTQSGIPYVGYVGVVPGVPTPTGLPFSPVRVSYRSSTGWVADNPPTDIYTHAPQIYAHGDDVYVFLGHDIDIHHGYLYRLTGQPWSSYIQLSASVTDGSSSVRWDPQRETNPNIIDTAYFNEDQLGNQTFIPRLLYMAVVPGRDATAPTVALTAPAAGTVVSGTSVAVSATASDNLGVAGVQFQLDGTSLAAEVTAPPYAITWDTTTAGNGPHTLTAVARDASGNTASSAETVSVDNGSPPPPPPPSGIALVKQLGTSSATGTGGAISLSVPSGGVAPGDTIVVWAAISGSGTTVSSITDSRGNSYTVDSTINSPSGGVNTFIGSGYATAPLAAGDKITITFSASYYSLRLAAASEFSGIPATGRLDQKAGATGSGTAPASGSAATTAQAVELVVGGFGSNSLATFTPAAGFSRLASVGATLSSVNLSIYAAYELVQTRGQYQAAGTLSASSRWNAAVATYR
jgi:hypothetical protein